MILATNEWGSAGGPALVCLHGVTGHGGRFRALAASLAERRAVGVDLRGHGRSGWEPPWSVERHCSDLVESCAELGIESAIWVGHSFGGLLVADGVSRRAPRSPPGARWRGRRHPSPCAAHCS